MSGGTYSCGCGGTADCNTSGGVTKATADTCGQFMGSGPMVCLCGTNLACTGGTHCNAGNCQ
jgi:hypothetical protein